MPNVSLNNVVQSDIRKLIGTRAFISGAIAAGTDTTKVKTTVAIDYTIDGVFCHLAITDNFWTLPTTISVIQPGSAAPPLPVSAAFGGAGLGAVTGYCFLGVNAAGTASAYWAAQPAAADLNLTDDSLVPDVPDNVLIVGYIKVVTAAATVFTPATTALATGNTVTYVNCSQIPSTLV